MNKLYIFLTACTLASQFPLTRVQQLAEVSDAPVVNGVPIEENQTQIVTDPFIVAQKPLIP